MRSILACAVLVFLGFGCAGDLDPGVAEDEAPIVESSAAATAITCDNPRTCAQACSCDYAECIAEGGGAKFCDEEKFQCVLDCKRF